MKDKKLEKGYLINFALFILLFMLTLLFMTASSSFVEIGLNIVTSKYITKSAASFCFVLIGFINLLYCIKNKQIGNIKFMILLALGLVFAMLGDIFLIEYFIIGAILFAVGHILFMISFFFFNWV